MSDGNTVLALALGAGGGVALWYFLRDEKKEAPAAKQDAHAAAPADQVTRPATSTAPNATAPTSSPRPCALRLEPSGLTADGVRVTIPDAVTRCKTAGRADITIIKDAPAAVYADLMIALGRAEVPATSHRNGSASRGARRRVAQSADSVDLPEFATFVLELADQIDEAPNSDGRARGRFGRKVFTAAIRRALRGTRYARLPRATVDDLLVRAHRAGLLELARADLVGAMDTDEVRDSEIVVPDVGATFHFVVAERSRNATTYREFTLRTYPDGHHGQATLRWFYADAPITWTAARDRLIAAGFAVPDLSGRTHERGGWMLSVDPHDYRADRAEPLP
jgi:hypothetical protein